MFSETGQRIVGPATSVIAAGVDSLARVVHLLVIPQMILSSKCSLANITEKGLGLTMNQNVPLELEL